MESKSETLPPPATLMHLVACNLDCHASLGHSEPRFCTTQ
jgi:hypothetical protein